MNELKLALIEGRLAIDPKLYYTKEGEERTYFDIAVLNSKNKVNFLTVKTFGKVADACAQYLKKGTLIRVKGQMKLWTKKDDTKKVVIFAKQVEFLGREKN